MKRERAALLEEALQPVDYPERLEAGTPNTPGIAGLKAGLEFIQQEGLLKIAADKHKPSGRVLKACLRCCEGSTRLMISRSET